MAKLSAITRPHNFQDMTGQRIGRLLVLECAGKRKGATLWRCRCDCGAEVISDRGNLREQRIKSCGCLRDEMTSKRSNIHKFAYLDAYKANRQRLTRPEYKIWRIMINRCNDPLHDAYKYYGGRGIKVCERWVKGDEDGSGFDCFFVDMGPRPTAKHSIDRYPDKDGNYCQSNCRWATMQEQANNKSNNVRLTVNGVTKTIAQWAETSGIPYKIIHERVRVLGWSHQDAVTIPPRKMRKRDKAVTCT